MDKQTERYHKLFISLRYWLLGASEQNSDWSIALDALEFSKTVHTGKRKNGWPEFQHQLEITHYLRTLHRGLLYPAHTFCAGLLHDAPEDYNISLAEIARFGGERTVRSVELLNKNHVNGTKKDPDQHFQDMAQDAIASVVKGADRINNHQSMEGAFGNSKQAAYMEETRKYILPMLKVARRNFPSQEPLYENIKFILNAQIELVSQKLALAQPSSTQEPAR